MKLKDEKELLVLALTAADKIGNPRLFTMLANLAAISSVSFSEDIETASISRLGRKYRIRFSPTFIRQYLKTPEDILFVLLHEIMHQLNGDFDRELRLENKVDRAVANLIEDISINSRLCQLFFPDAVPLFRLLYSPDCFPDVLLVPPLLLLPNLCSWPSRDEISDSFMANREFYYQWQDQLQIQFEQVSYPNYLHWERIMDDLSLKAKFSSRWYLEAWLWAGLQPIEDLYDRIRPLFPDPLKLILLGDHDCPREKIEGWDEVFEYDRKAGYSDQAQEEEIEVVEPRQHVTPLMRMIRRAIEPDSRNPLEAMIYQPERGVMPWPGRRENLWLAQGLWPVFFKPPTLTMDQDYLRPHVYIDVSGSTGEHQPLIYGLIVHCSDLIGQPVYLFSNTVVEASLQDIRKGRVTTTGGTDFDCVIEHATKNHFRKLILITDGCAEMNEKHQAKVRSGEVKLFLVLTDPRYHLCEVLAAHARGIFYLNT